MARFEEKTQVDFVVIGGGGAGAIVAKVWVSPIQRFKRRCLDLDGNTKLKSKAATMETTHPSFPTLPSLQTQNSTPQSSMSAKGLITAKLLPSDPPSLQDHRHAFIETSDST
jgi:hypothetical protein